MDNPRNLLQPYDDAVSVSAGGLSRRVSATTLVSAQSGLIFAKFPHWVDQKLLFLDIHDRCIKSADLHGTVRNIKALPYLPSSFGVLADGTLIVGDASSRLIYRLESADLTPIADLSGVARFHLSDVVADSRGGMYFGDAGFDFLDPLVDPVPSGVIIHTNVYGKSSIVAEGLFFPNGMIVTPDNKTLVVAETLGHRLTAFEIEDDGSLQNRRAWAQLEDDVQPDGICLDLEGAIWIAGSGSGAMRVLESGEIDQQITTERPVFAAALGGPERRHLFLCTSNSSDPVITRRGSGATIDVAEVAIPGNRIP